MVLSGMKNGAKVAVPMDSAEMADLITKLVTESPRSKEQAAAFQDRNKRIDGELDGHAMQEPAERPNEK